MTHRKSYFKIFIACILALTLFIPFIIKIGSVFADTLTVTELVDNYYEGSDKNQEITDDLGFSTDSTTNWTIPEYLDKPKYKIKDDQFTIEKLIYTISEDEVTQGNNRYAIEDNSFTVGDLTYRIIGDYVTTGKSVLKNNTFPYSYIEGNGNYNLLNIVDLSSEETFTYNDNQKLYKDIDNTTSINPALMFLTSTSGVLGIESPSFTIPAHALYILTFKVRIVDIKNSKGLNAKIISSQTGEEVVTSMDARKDKGSLYTTYAFLIRGNEFTSQDIKLQLLWGNVTEKIENEKKYYAAISEIGYAIVDNFQLFSVTTAQYDQLATDKTKIKTVNLSTTSSPFITNGGFSLSDNNVWNLSHEHPKLMDLVPSGWTQSTAITHSENDRRAHYGIVELDNFITRMADLGWNFVKPVFPIPGATNENVLMLYNGQPNGTFENIYTYQTLTSSEITLTKNKYFELSFKFNTPALAASAEEENNSLNFYIVDANNNILYSREDMYSYTEWSDNANEWSTFRCFIRSPNDTDKKIKFLICFGTENDTKSGYAYVDYVQLTQKLNADVMYDNPLDKDKYILTSNEGEDPSYLATGVLTFDNLKALNFSNNLIANNGANRDLGVYDFTTAISHEEPDDEEPNDQEPDHVDTAPTVNIKYLWYVIPSILLGVCMIMGLIIFYAQRIKSKIKIPKKYKKGSYDRKKTLEKQVAQREKTALRINNNIQKELDDIRAKITKLESNYQKSKLNPLALKEYIRKREHLQKEEIRLQDKLNKK